MGGWWQIHKVLHYNQQVKNRLEDHHTGMVSALKYLHDHNILHNDIKSDNIVIDDRFSIECVVIDFGKSGFAADGRSYTQRRNDVDTQSSTHKLHPIFGMVIVSNSNVY